MTLQSQLDDAQARLQQGNFNDAIKIYTEILGSNRAQPDALYMLGAVAFKLGQIPQALEFATALTANAPRDARGWMLKGLALRAQRRINEALAAARMALSIDDSLAEAWECAGMVLMQQGQWHEAHEHFERALTRLPDSAILRGCYAMALA